MTLERARTASPTRPRRTAADGARIVLAAASVGAGLIHIAFAPEHLEEYRPLGVGFVAAGLLQLVAGPQIALRGSRRAVLAAGALSVAFAAVYVLTLTVGLPVGPEAFEPEGVSAAGLICCALEVLLALGALALAAARSRLRAPLSALTAAAVAGAVLLTGAGTAFAVQSPGHHSVEHGDHGGHACPAAPVLTGELDARGVDTGVTAYFSCRLRHEHDGPH